MSQFIRVSLLILSEHNFSKTSPSIALANSLSFIMSFRPALPFGDVLLIQCIIPRMDLPEVSCAEYRSASGCFCWRVLLRPPWATAQSASVPDRRPGGTLSHYCCDNCASYRSAISVVHDQQGGRDKFEFFAALNCNCLNYVKCAKFLYFYLIYILDIDLYFTIQAKICKQKDKEKPRNKW